MTGVPSRRPGRAAFARGLAERLRAVRVSRRAWAVALSFCAVGVLGLVAFAPLVRGRIEAEAAARRLDVTVGSVRPGFFAVVLGDVRVRPQGIAGIEARLERVRVGLGASLSLRDVRAQGGAVQIDGDPEGVVERLRTVRRGGEPEGARRNEPDRRSADLDIEGISLSWTLPSGGEMSGLGLRIRRDAGAMSIGCARCAASHQGLRIEVEGADVELAPDGAPRRIGAAALRIVRERRASVAQVPPPAGTDLEPPPLPQAPAKRPVKTGAVAAPAKAAVAGANVGAAGAAAQGEDRLFPLPDLHVLRGRIAAAASMVAPRLADGMTVEIGGLSANVDMGGDAVALGPGAFTLARHGDTVHVTFASEKNGTAGTPLAIDADLPLGPGDVLARLSGGPVSLSTLGVKEGTKGLFDVARGTISGKGQLVLAAAGDVLTFDGQVALRSISIKNARLSTEPVRDLELDAGGRGVLDDAGKLRIDDAQLDVKALHVRAHGTVEDTRDHFGVSLGLEVAPAACQSLLESTPPGLLPTARAMRMNGTFAATARVGFDTRSLDKLVLEYDIDDQCRVAEVPRDLSRDHFGDAFTYRTYHPDGTAFETTTGPGSTNWTNLEDISPFMVAAVLTTEDGAFYKHHGFNHWAIRSSVQANLKSRRFVRGASTITMQLAKNLFLSREKTLSRKIEEVILTDYLEQTFRKDDMMELYLNIVEFGPDVYGITQAADYYFARRPDELNVAECFFLATLLPAPSRYGKLREKGEVPESWMKHLHALMEIAAKNGKITKAELDAGLAERVIFVREGDGRPEPRKPVTNGRRDPYEDNGVDSWQPLD